MKKILFLTTLLLICTLSFAQYSELRKFNAHKSTDVLIRTDYTRTYFVTHYKPSRGNACNFIVEHGTTTKYMSLMQAYANMTPIHPFGYEIKDMRIIGQECYFCGRKWTETGNIIYGIDGSMEYERVYKGIIGRFDVRDVVQSGGSYEIMEIDTTCCLDKLAVLASRVLATGTLYDGYTPCLVSLAEVDYASGEIDFNYRVMTSAITGEHFFDVTASDNKFISVSRYNSTAATNKYNYYFGLRYGTGYNFYSTNSGIYDYNVQNVIGNEGASFISMEPVLITSTKTDDEVVVAYINRKTSNRVGMPIFYKIPDQGLAISKILIAIGYNNTVQNKAIKEIQYNNPLVSTSRMAVLLEDVNGKSILRFPDWNIITNWYDTILTTTDYKLESIAPYQFTSGSLEVRTAGYYPSSDNRIVQLLTNDIHGYQGKWATSSCIPYSKGVIEEVKPINAPLTFNSSKLNSFYYKAHTLFTSVDFTPIVSSRTNLCIK